jgi:hypothetical protein
MSPEKSKSNPKDADSSETFFIRWPPSPQEKLQQHKQPNSDYPSHFKLEDNPPSDVSVSKVKKGQKSNLD